MLSSTYNSSIPIIQGNTGVLCTGPIIPTYSKHVIQKDGFGTVDSPIGIFFVPTPAYNTVSVMYRIQQYTCQSLGGRMATLSEVKSAYDKGFKVGAFSMVSKDDRIGGQIVLTGKPSWTEALASKTGNQGVMCMGNINGAFLNKIAFK
jgi:hypothetical protein